MTAVTPDANATRQAATTGPSGLDPRGPRFGAAITTIVLAAALVLASPVLLALQAVVFAIGAIAGPARQPYGLVFKHLVRPRLAPPTHLEDPAAPRFAQACGLAFSLVGLLGFAVGVQWLALGAIGFALAAAFLNAAFDFCIGCELYLRAQRLRRA
ncbi:MAG TPA: DUF4395 domain-containing protein [Candidatus Nanopelagicales bacterium]